MSAIQRPLATAAAVLALALLAPGLAQAQGFTTPGPVPQPRPYWYGPNVGNASGIGTGVQYDLINKAKAEHQLAYRQAKLQRDAERGNAAAVEHDARRIEFLRYRIAVDDWLIRKNRNCPTPYYPVRNDANCFP